MTRQSGQTLLHYRLVEKIGQGGMGSVWRAQDTTLERDAAIKILPQELANDSRQLARFEREAKLLASLNHPNLAAVFGVHDIDSTRFLAMELVPGEDLARRLQRGRLAPDEVVSIMVPIADALEAAHRKGVIHRDLKPANVMLTPDGRVKVLDFGLAKAVEGDASGGSGSADFPLTATGVVLGTAPYMSPEQARGRPVDARTDIWSYGCVLWECLTGERPFQGQTVPDLVAAILNDEPDWGRLPEGTPQAVVRLLRRCLVKKPRDRLHHVADARIELEEAVEERGAEPVAPAGGKPAPAPRRPAVPLLALALAAALGALLVVLLQGGGAPAVRERVLSDARFVTLTADFPGDELGAAISADGSFVAFLANRRGVFEPFMGQIGGEYLNVRERNSAVGDIHAPKARGRCVGFRGDENGLWLGGGPGQKVRKVPLIGSGTDPWLDEGVMHVDWSPDATRIVYSQSTGGDPVFVADADGGNSKEVLGSEEGNHQHFPTWSPKGLWIYLVRGHVRTDEMDLWRLRPDGTGLEQLTEGLRNVMFPAPIDERTVLFVANDADGSGPWLWELDVGTRVWRRATIGPARYTSVSASRDGRRLVATVANPQVGLYTIPIPSEGQATEDAVKAHPLKAVRALAPRLRGDQLFYLSSRGGGDGLWRYRNGEAREIWKGSDAPLLVPAAISPDGTRVAVVAREGRRSRLYVMRSDGTDRQPLMDQVDIVGAACWSPDGKWIAAGGRKGSERGLFKVDVHDGRTTPLGSVEAMNPVWSPQGDMIVFEGPQVSYPVPLLAVTPDGARIEWFPQIAVRPFGERARFLPDGSGLVYLKGVNPYQEFHLLDLASAKRGEEHVSRQLTDLADWDLRTFDITPDGKTIVFDRKRDNSDIVLIERGAGR